MHRIGLEKSQRLFDLLYAVEELWRVLLQSILADATIDSPPLRHPHIAIVAYYRLREIKKLKCVPITMRPVPRRGTGGARGGLHFTWTIISTKQKKE